RDFGALNVAYGKNVGGTASCTTQSGAFTHAFQVENSGPSLANVALRVATDVAGAPPGALVSWFLDDRDWQFRIGALCAPVHAAPIQIPLGAADSTGARARDYLAFPYNAAFEGLTLYSQLAAFDSTQTGLPVALSQGQFARMPAATSPGTECAYLWTQLPSTT